MPTFPAVLSPPFGEGDKEGVDGLCERFASGFGTRIDREQHLTRMLRCLSPASSRAIAMTLHGLQRGYFCDVLDQAPRLTPQVRPMQQGQGERRRHGGRMLHVRGFRRHSHRVGRATTLLRKEWEELF